MRVRTLFAVLMLVAVVFIMRSSAQTPAANGTFVAGEIIVKFRPGVNAGAKADAHRQGGGTGTTEIVRTGLQLATVLLSLGKFAIGRYLATAGVTSVYGAAGSLVMLVLWIYYSAQILLLGAEVTHVYANKQGSRLEPSLLHSESGSMGPRPVAGHFTKVEH